MPSSVKAFVTVELWNRKLHYYFGLFFLFFLWLFSLTGLLLNHPQWRIASAGRNETRYEQAVKPPYGDTELARARDLMRQLKLTGEINWPAAQKAGYLGFSVSRPNDASQIQVDLLQNRASVQHFQNSRWATFRIFHTFSGSRVDDPATNRDWILTSVWVVAMDGLAVGLIVMVLGSYYMWYQLKKKRALGIVVLSAGVVSCGLFVAGFV
jgi:hypothetical protein